MANLLTLDCPIDGLPLVANRSPNRVSWDPSGRPVHVHIEIQFAATCLNGHQWSLDGMLTLERTA